jgi:2,3-bisphosphoglycerate-dependent phosphoglycerate mutase
MHLFLVRHCQSSGQAPDAPLTPLGHQQAEQLADVLQERGVARIVSSPYTRAVQTAQPLAQRLGLPLETDARLRERALTTDWMDDYRAQLRDAWADHDLALPGGESSRAATQRGMAALTDILTAGPRPTVVVSHGNLLALLLHAFDGRPGYATWEALSNPDLFEVTHEPPATFTATRTWTP